MKTLFRILLYGLVFFTVACNQSGKQVKTDSKNETSSNEAISGDEVSACPHSSKIFWTGSNPTAEHNGFIKLKEGKYIVEHDKLVGGEFTIDMSSIVDIDIDDAGMNAKLVADLKSVNFFYVDSFPEGKFVISNVSELKDDEYTHEIKGNLTLKSITHPISFKAKVRVANGKVNATSEEFIINRTLWNINYGSKSFIKDIKNELISDELKLELDMHSM